MRQWINLAGMLNESQEPAFEHDCSRCEFVGTDVPQKGEPQTNQVDMYIHHNPSHTILIRRYGSEPANYASHSYYPNMPLPEKYQRVLDAASHIDESKSVSEGAKRSGRFKLFHGTSESAEKIRKQGLVRGRHDGVFLTDNPQLALEYGESDQERTGSDNLTLVSVELRHLDQNLMKPDIDHSSAETWQESLAETDQCMYMGDIPPQYLNIEVYGDMKEGLKKPRWELPPEPGTAPIPDDHVRLYHQTKISNLPSIRKHGIQLKYARGIEGPKAIYADTQGFYEKPDYAPTVEFSIPKERWDKPFVIGDVEPSSIIGIHKPWHKTARYIEDNPEVLNSVLSGEHDDLLGDHHYGPAIRFIKHKHARR